MEATESREEVNGLIEEFRMYTKSDEGKSHLIYLKEREPRETKELLEKLRSLPKNSNEFVELVLYGLLPYSKTKYAKRVSLAPAFQNIKQFFAKRFKYSEDDWKELAKLIYDLTDKFQENPNNLENLIRTFISHKFSKAIQCGSLTPIFFAINQDFPIVNNREIRSYRKLTFLILDRTDELSQKLENYLSNVEKIKKLVIVMSSEYNFKEIKDMAVFDLFCYWYDQYKNKESKSVRTEAARKERKTRKIKEGIVEIEPIEDRYVTKFLQVLACSPPQPFLVETLKKFDNENKIIYNTEFQRGEVWDLTRKQKLIDSILRGYNINTIFLRQLHDGKYECLDGQQRLKTVLKEFLNNEFSINPRISPEFKKEVKFEELPDSLKSKIKSYIIYAIIFYTTDDEETCKIFLRLQEGLPLNSAEKLNAMIGFLRNEIVEASKHSFIKNLGIKDYRFAHRYLLAQSYLLTLRNQITDIKRKNLQEMYETYRTTRPHESVKNSVNKVLNFLDGQFEEDTKIIRYNADFISLYLLGKHIIENYAVNTSPINLKKFFIQFIKIVGEVESSEDEKLFYYDYKTYRKTSADSRNSVQRRFDIILSKFLEFNQTLIPKDPNRNFDYWEKLAIYHRDNGICQLCNAKILFDKGTIDHKKPHSKGGKTIIENGQWSCVPCNLKKSDKF